MAFSAQGNDPLQLGATPKEDYPPMPLYCPRQYEPLKFDASIERGGKNGDMFALKITDDVIFKKSQRIFYQGL